jgi:spore coat polysaccharide biosynthesis protein SpsF
MKVVATIEARMESSRLPGKTLAPILGRPMLEMFIERLRRARRVDQVVVATTTNRADDAIEELARRLGVGWFRGSSDDVLQRVLLAARKYEADVIVETTGDDPFIDPGTIDEAIAIFMTGKYDHVSNAVEKTYPLGLETQVFPVKVLAEVDHLTQDPADRENVSLYIYEHPEKYRLGHLFAPPKIRGREVRLTVDTQPDLDLARAIYERLYPTNPAFSIYEVIELLDREPELARMNQRIPQKQARP